MYYRLWGEKIELQAAGIKELNLQAFQIADRWEYRKHMIVAQ